jgi:hypothetical protein
MTEQNRTIFFLQLPFRRLTATVVSELFGRRTFLAVA